MGDKIMQKAGLSQLYVLVMLLITTYLSLTTIPTYAQDAENTADDAADSSATCTLEQSWVPEAHISAGTELTVTFTCSHIPNPLTRVKMTFTNLNSHIVTESMTDSDGTSRGGCVIDLGEPGTVVCEKGFRNFNISDILTVSFVQNFGKAPGSLRTDSITVSYEEIDMEYMLEDSTTVETFTPGSTTYLYLPIIQ